MWFKIKSYLTFLLKSTNQYGVHSPFVYDLIVNCFQKKTSKVKKKEIYNIRKSLFSNNSIIHVNDLGNGSKVFKTNHRKASEIAKVAGISKKRAYLLIRIVEYFNFQQILELGTSLGLGTSTLSIANTKSKITTLEGCENTAKTARNLFQRFNLNNIKIVIGDFKDTLHLELKNNHFDLIYIDGNHQKKETLHYFNQCLASINNNSVLIFDDINWSYEMQEVWLEIKENPKVTVTIDTFFWGMVFFRKEQQKQHFVLRV